MRLSTYLSTILRIIRAVDLGDLVEQIRTGLILTEELTELEIIELLTFLEREPARSPVEILDRLREAARSLD